MTQLTLSLLGPFQAKLEQELIDHFHSAKTQGFLVYLVMNCDRPQPREVIATLFWPEESEKNGRNNLRQSLYHLRKLLGDSDKPDQPFLIVSRQAVQFNPESSYVLDVNQFLQAIEGKDLETAISFYKGELLPGFTCDSAEFEDWLRLEREKLHRLALEAMFDVTQTHLENGRYLQAQSIAQQQLSHEPWRESAHRQLMRALALAGDRNNALRQYEICRDSLREELGIEPAPETTTLFEEIQAGRYSAKVSTDSLRPPVKARHNLPVDTTPFIGREVELDRIKIFLTHDSRRLVSIIGPGGMGKTRLALAAGSKLLEHYADGVFFVDLASISHHDAIPHTIATVLDYQPPDRQQSLWRLLLKSLSRRNLLLILDNFEHLLAGASLVNDILQTSPQVSLLVTSRQRLNLASETRFELGGMDFPETITPQDAMAYTAVQLFVESGRRARSSFALTRDNLADVVRICQLVQGMPLGLILAAAWLEMLTTAEIVAEVEDCLYFLAADLVDLPERQRSVRAVFERSWEMMLPEEQSVLAKLSVFRGGFTREAAEQIANANLRLLLSLTNKSLLHRQPDSGRFAIHELLRQFAALKLQRNKHKKEVYLAHCRYYAQLVAQETIKAINMYPVHLYRKHLADVENINRAWNYAQKHGISKELADMVRGMSVISFGQGIPPTAMLNEAIDYLKQRGVKDTDLEMLHLRLVEFNTRMDRDEHLHFRPKFLEFIALLEEQNDPSLYWGYDCMAFLDVDYHTEESFKWHEKAYFAALELNDEILIKRTQALTLWFLIDSGFPLKSELAQLVEFQEFPLLESLKKLLAYFEPEYSNVFVVFSLLMSLTVHCLTLKMYEEAIYYGKRGLNIAKEWHDLYWMSFAGDRLADIYLNMGRPDQAAFHLLYTLEWHLSIGQVWQTLGYLWSKPIRFDKLFGGVEKIVPIISMVYYHPESTPFYRQEVARVRPQYENEIGEEVFAAAWEKGRDLNFDSAVSQVCSILSQESSNLTPLEPAAPVNFGPQ